jgi:hypothetical protein
MATAFLSLFPGGYAPDGSSGNASAAYSYEKSTGTPPSNAPNVHQVKLLFDADTDEHWCSDFIMPGDYASGGTLRGVFKMTSATSGNVKWKGAQSSTTDASTADSAKVYDTVAVAANAAAPGTLGQTASFTIDLTMTGAAANRLCCVMIGRDADDGTNDTATGDAELLGLSFEYVTS